MAERYIGIDFGTSGSLIRVMLYEDGKPIEKSLDPKPVTFNNGQATTTPTVVRTKEDADDIPPAFGHAATRKHGYIIHENFKTDLESSNPEVRAKARKLTEEFFGFMGKTYRHQSECGLFGNVDDKVHTIVSYPVKWSEDTCSFMVDAAQKAGFPDVTGMDEAKAAIQAVTVLSEGYLLQKGLLKKDQEVTILLIDMGAGTTDLVLCSYTPGKNAQILSTWPKGGEIFFGGKEIDDKLPQFFLDKKVIEPQEILKTTLERLGSSNFKAWKENTVSPALEHNDVVSEFTAFENHINLLKPYVHIVEKDFALDRGAFEKVLGKDLEKFPQLVNGCLADAKVPGSDVDLVILTGGHSQWYFVKEMLAGKMPQYGKLELTKIIADPSRMVQIARPQETVARGLVYTPLCGKEIVNPEDLYQQGLELEKSNPEKANELYLQAAELEHTGAMNRLGYNCQFGIGTTKDFEKAILWYQKATVLDCVDAMNNLGTCYAKGTGVSKNQEKANKFYQKAAGLGSPHGMYNLGYNLIFGNGIFINAKLGLEWMKKAADLGLERAKQFVEYTPESEFEYESISGLNEERIRVKKYKGTRKTIVIPPTFHGVNIYFDTSVFSLNKSMECVIFPDTMTDINSGLFSYCENLKVVIAHSNIESIGAYAFHGCDNLKTIDFGMGSCEPGTVKFPPNLRYIGANAFAKYKVFGFGDCIFKRIVINKKTEIEEKTWKTKTIDSRVCKIEYYDA